MALVTPLLLMILMGTVTAGIAVNHKITVTDASRDAARYGATVPATQCVPTSACNNRTWAQLVQAVAVERSDGLATSNTICVALVSGPGSAPVAVDSDHTTAGGTTPCFADNSSDTALRVQVAVTRSDQIQAIVFARSLTLTGRAVTRFEQ